MAGSDRDPRLKSATWRRVRLAVLDRDLGRCQVRGARCTGVATEVDHVVPPAEGGDFWAPANLRASCRRCNLDRRRRRRGGRYRTGEAHYLTRF